MPDICMCLGGHCPKKKQCYRHNAKADSPLQTFFISPPYSGKNCDHFWPDEKAPLMIGQRVRVYFGARDLPAQHCADGILTWGPGGLEHSDDLGLWVPYEGIHLILYPNIDLILPA